MDESDFAKNLLLNKNVVKTHHLEIIGKIDLIDIYGETYFQDGSFVERMKFSVPVQLQEEDSEILNIRTQKDSYHYIYTNWNIENENIKRNKKSRMFICDNVCIYENELFHSVLKNVHFKESIQNINPFELDIRKPKSFITADVIFFVNANIAKFIVPNIKNIYYIVVEKET